AAETVGVQQADGVDAAVRRATGGAFGPRIDDGEVEVLRDAAHEHDGQREDCEQRYGVRQQVAEPLDEAEEALNQPLPPSGGRCDGAGVTSVASPSGSSVIGSSHLSGKRPRYSGCDAR